MKHTGNEDRFDVLLSKLGITRSRSEAEDLIKRGLVSARIRVGDVVGEFVPVRKPSKLVARDTVQKEDIRIEANQYVGRGAYKLETALDTWKINPKECVALDIGASTGGFTEVLIRRDAQCVFAVDVGANQLADSLRGSSRVVSLEKTDIQELGNLPPLPVPVASSSSGNSGAQSAHSARADIIVIDVSFISLTQIFKHLKRFANPNHCQVVALIKPQFEVGKSHIQKDGVVGNKKQIEKAIEKVKVDALSHGFACKGVIESPIHGGSGNVEYLGYFVSGSAV